MRNEMRFVQGDLATLNLTRCCLTIAPPISDHTCKPMLEALHHALPERPHLLSVATAHRKYQRAHAVLQRGEQCDACVHLQPSPILLHHGV
jgi:hypothetical protein